MFKILPILFLSFICGNKALPQNNIEENVDLIELNHFYDKKGLWLYDQTIFWTIDPNTGKMHVRSWLLIDHHKKISKTNNIFIVRYVDDKNTYRIIKSINFKESRTQFDPERENKEICPESLRIKLVDPKLKIKDIKNELDTTPSTLE